MTEFFLGVTLTIIAGVVTAQVQATKTAKTPLGRAKNLIEDYENTGSVKYLIDARQHLENEIFRERAKEKARQDRES